MSEFKRQACICALKDEGIKEDWRLIYFYEDAENPNIWHLKQGIDYLGSYTIINRGYGLLLMENLNPL